VSRRCDNGRRIRVRVNDRGPFARGRIIDLSRQGAKDLGFYDKGSARVRVRYVGPAPLVGLVDGLGRDAGKIEHPLQRPPGELGRSFVYDDLVHHRTGHQAFEAPGAAAHVADFAPHVQALAQPGHRALPICLAHRNPAQRAQRNAHAPFVAQLPAQRQARRSPSASKLGGADSHLHPVSPSSETSSTIHRHENLDMAAAGIEQRIESAEQFFSRINARVAHQGNRAFYSTADDTITLPPFVARWAPQQ